MTRILVVFGTRPEAIKMAPVVRALEGAGVETLVCVTAQHREMLQQTLGLFAIEPAFDLDLMRPDQELAGLSARILEQLTPVLVETAPDAVLVQGDTTTTLCAALASFYLRVPVGHVEAGLRTGDNQAPFPEEMNRVLSTRLATWHFAPTDHNRRTLLSEGVSDEVVFVTGNPVIDSLIWVSERIHRGACAPETLDLLARFRRPYILVTGHRRESFGHGFESLCEALRELASKRNEMDILYPVHLNPRVQEPVYRILADSPNVHLMSPLGYEPFVALMMGARFVLTDSGGVQEEAPSLGKPVLVMRDKSERVEALQGGVRLVGTDRQRIIAESVRLLDDEQHYKRMSTAINPYGDGAAGTRIAEILTQRLG